MNKESYFGLEQSPGKPGNRGHKRLDVVEEARQHIDPDLPLQTPQQRQHQQHLPQTDKRVDVKMEGYKNKSMNVEKGRMAHVGRRFPTSFRRSMSLR